MARNAERLRSSSCGSPASGRSLLHIDRMMAVLEDPSIYQLASTLPERDPGGPGRKNVYPDVVYLLNAAFTGYTGSGRKSSSTLGHPHFWPMVKNGVRDMLGPDVAASLPEVGPTRNQCLYNADRLAEHVSALMEAQRELALEQALRQGNLAASGGLSVTNPPRANFVVADGTVVTSAIKKSTAERSSTRRRDEGAGWHHEAGEDSGQPVYGPKYWMASVRPDNTPNNRVIVDVRRCPPGSGYGGEAGLATQALLELKQRAPGLHCVCYDGALRGTHHDELMRAGLLVVSPVHGANKPTLFRRVTCERGCSHELWASEGAIHEGSRLDTGELHLEPCPIIGLEKRRGRQQTRWYTRVSLSCGQFHRERLIKNKEDDLKKFHRSEHLRQYPPNSDTYGAVYGWREDAESVNSNLDSTLWNRRMIALTPERQDLVMLGFWLAQNAISRKVHLSGLGSLPVVA